VTGADVAVTLARVAEPALDPGAMDGVDLASLLAGEIPDLPPRVLCWHFPHYHHQGLGPCSAIIDGDYKLIEWLDPEFSQRSQAGACELFNLGADPRESTDLAALKPEKADSLLASLHAWRHSVGAQEMAPNPHFDPGKDTVLASGH
jgi:arylsulfatase A-like enzyme